MKAFKILVVLLLVSWQANATGFSHNMLVAQKMLNAKEKGITIENQKPNVPLQLVAPTTAIRPTSQPTATESEDEEVRMRPEITAVSLSQHIARWVVRVVTAGGRVLAETLISVFSSGNQEALPTNASFISLTENVLSYLVTPSRLST